MRIVWLAIITIIFTSLSSLSHAQFEDLGGIIEEIIKGSQIPGQTPIYEDTAIETIPVTIIYDVPVPLDDHTLTLSAYTPHDPSGISKDTQLLGQTRLMMNGLSPPVKLGLTIPSAMTKDLTFIRISAEIHDTNNNRVMIHEREGIFRGSEPPSLTLISASQSAPISKAPEISVLELINGEVFIRDKARVPNNGTLTIQLLENALAGGRALSIAAEKTISIEQNYPPYAFTLERGLVAGNHPNVLSLKAWITDWAGRKTHVLRKPVSYNGPDTQYKIILDALAQGNQTSAGKHLNPALMAQTLIEGEAFFDPRNGIPREAKMKVTLSKSIGAFGENPTLATQTIIVNARDTRIPFSLSTASTNFDPFIPAPILKLEIIDSRGNIYYDSGDIVAVEGVQMVQLYARRGF